MPGKFVRISAISLLVVMLTAFLTPTTAYAAVGITSVTPDSIVNGTSNTITIIGTGFADTSVVLLSGYGALATTFLNSGTLTAVVPAGITAGNYDVTVKNSDSDSTTCSQCLVVIGASLSGRPQIVVKSTDTNVSVVQYGQEFKFTVNFENAGTVDAYDVKVTFTSEDLTPTKNGGVEAIGTIPAGGNASVDQRLIPTGSLYGKEIVLLTAAVTYFDSLGASYTDSFVLAVKAMAWAVVTATPTGVRSSQLMITSYGINLEFLQPGLQFTLTMTVQNVGNARAQRVTMIVGGGSSGGSNGGTPSPGGVSGGSGEFTNFAPVGASNVQSLGDMAGGAMMQVSQNLIVNVSTTPGAYPMKITFSYVNDKGEVINDEQVITLLVYDLPKLDISFYRDPGQIFAGQPNVLPIQIVNLGKRSAVLGNMKIETSNGTLDQASTLVGPLDSYFTFDANLTPETSGPLQVTVTVDYTDDFNQPRSITHTFDLIVEETFVESPSDPSKPGGEEAIASEENIFHKIWRFILGVFGLDSAPPDDGTVPGEEISPDTVPIAPPGGGKG
ncbi:MAG: IPT/TIG domain-containing protein [Chloroflexi bacterium]|nr:IPT/TIG domain-containing protein [Chloroflexota bacterium]